MFVAVLATPLNCLGKLKSFFVLKEQKNTNAAQKIKFFIKDFSSKSDQIRRKLQIWSNVPEKSLIENFIFCAVKFPQIIHHLN